MNEISRKNFRLRPWYKVGEGVCAEWCHLAHPWKPSTADIKVLEDLKINGSPQEISEIIPIGKEKTVKFGVDGIKLRGEYVNGFRWLFLLMGRKKVDYVLVNTRFGYSIVNKRERKMLLVCDDELHEELVKKMLENGNAIYADINEAFMDV